MKKLLFIAILIQMCIASPYLIAQEKELPPPIDKTGSFVIFDSNTSIDIAYDSCNKESAEQDVWSKNNVINWEWNNKRNSWCGWGIQQLPKNDFSNLENHKLEIKLSGKWSDKKAPQVKFMDGDDKSTKLLRITQGERNGNPNSKEGAIYTIPISKFKMNRKIDDTYVKTIQFDAAFESIKGEVVIYSIKIIE